MSAREQIATRLEVVRLDDAGFKLAASYAEIVRRDFPALIKAHYDRLTAQGVKATVLGPRRKEFESLICRHFELMFIDLRSEAFLKSFETLIELEIDINAGARGRLGASTILIEHLFAEVAKKVRLRTKLATKSCDVIYRVVLADILAAIAVHTDRADQHSAVRAEQLAEIVSGFRAQGEEIAHSVRATSTDLADSVAVANRSLQSAAKDVSASSSAVGEAQLASSGTAAAVEELAASIAEIRTKAQQSSGQSTEAVTNANNARSAVSNLSEAASHVGSIVSTIANIAAQTNLLALNATIEAARAGEAGRGFAVVASEVKDLATQTAEATGKITEQISQIQAAAEACVLQISTIVTAVESASQMAVEIASAVDQQANATHEISAQAQASNQSTGRIAETVMSLDDQIRMLTSITEKMLGSAKAVDQSSERFAGGMDGLIARLGSAG